MSTARVSVRGAERWMRGHPWIFRSDVETSPDAPGLVDVTDHRGKFLGQALCSPRSEMSWPHMTPARYDQASASVALLHVRPNTMTSSAS